MFQFFEKSDPSVTASEIEVTTNQGAVKLEGETEWASISPNQRKKSSPFFGGVTAKIIRSGDKPILVLPL